MKFDTMELRNIHNPSLKKIKLLKSLILSSKKDIDNIEELLTEYLKKRVILLNSARAGIYLGLEAKNFRRTDEILVPKYTSQDVLNAINHTAFPSTKLSSETKAILLLHQYGYPQKISEMREKIKDLFVIEDCAHSMDSEYNNVKVGNFFDFSVYSFPKIYSTIQGGCIATNDEEIIDYVNVNKKN